MSATEIKEYLDENRLQCCEGIEHQKLDGNAINRRTAYRSRNGMEVEHQKIELTSR